MTTTRSPIEVAFYLLLTVSIIFFILLFLIYLILFIMGSSISCQDVCPKSSKLEMDCDYFTEKNQMVSLTLNGNFLCNGILLSTDSLLTANSCIDKDNFDEIIVRADTRNWATGLESYIEKAIELPNHGKQFVVICFLKEQFNENKAINYVSPTFIPRNIKHGDELAIISWRVQDKSKIVNEDNLDVHVSQMNNNKCQSTDTLVCLKEKFNGQCSNDLGAPVFLKTVLSGIVIESSCTDNFITRTILKLSTIIDDIRSALENN